MLWRKTDDQQINACLTLAVMQDRRSTRATGSKKMPGELFWSGPEEVPLEELMFC